jgi:integrase
MIEDMQVRNYSPRTVEAYVAAVAKLAKHFRRSPDQLGGEEIRAFQVDLLAQQTSWSQFNQIVAGLRFFFGTTLLRPGMVEMLPYGKRPKRLPVVLSVEEVAQLLEAARPGRERMLLQTAYACGLRISELLNLQVTDIDSARMVVNVRQGKVKLADGEVIFRYRDYADSRKEKLLTLPAEEFLRRFVMHVLPKGFMKIRHYGLLANGQRRSRLTQCRRLLFAAGVTAPVAASAPGDATIAPAEVRRCPRCGSCRIVVAELDPESCAAAAVPDSS